VHCASSSPVFVDRLESDFRQNVSLSSNIINTTSNTASSNSTRNNLTSDQFRRNESMKYLLNDNIAANILDIVNKTRNVIPTRTETGIMNRVFNACRKPNAAINGTLNKIFSANNLTCQATNRDAWALEGENYQYGSVIDCYVNILRNRMTSLQIKRVHIELTYFYAKLMKENPEKPRESSYNYDYHMTRIFRNRNIFELFDIVLFPIHRLRLQHWIIVRVDFVNKTIICIDSLNQSDNHNFTGNIFRFIQDEYQEQYSTRLNTEEWIIINNINCPQQRNGHDCGVFVMMFLDVLIEEIPLNVITQEFAKNYRIKIGNDLLRGKLKY
jgi:Ulp1 family protease